MPDLTPVIDHDLVSHISASVAMQEGVSLNCLRTKDVLLPVLLIFRSSFDQQLVMDEAAVSMGK